MSQNMRNSGKGTSSLFSQLASEKKKSVTALCLIGVMVFMWVRVLGKKTSEDAEGALTTQEVNADSPGSNPELKISFTELPKVKGRNDVLTRDFFAAGDWQDFIEDGEGGNSSGNEEVSVVSTDGSEEIIKRAAKKLKLEAIVLGKKPQAFINDKLLAVGDKLLIVDGADTHEFEVAGIEEKRVFIRCGEAEITLRLTQTSITDY